MPAFQAINLEPEENVDEEVDDTRQIQVDDALKRFQAALRLHAQGPQFFDEAEHAYDDLFKSDIFGYPEAATEYERAERQPDQLTAGALFPPALDTGATDIDGSGSSFPQALYLSHKNHGQFLLDRIRHDARATDSSRADFFKREAVVSRAHTALSDFNAALDRDPSDAELWRRTARLASFLRSARTARYCLEAAIELDDDPAVDEVEPPSLAEGLAGEQLKDQLHVLGDDMSLSHPILTPWIRRNMPAMVRKLVDPMPFLPDSSKVLALPLMTTRQGIPQLVMPFDSASWTAIGMTMVGLRASHGASGDQIIIEVPGVHDNADVLSSPAEMTDSDAVREEQRQLELQLASEVAHAESQDKQATSKDNKSDAQPPPGLSRKGSSMSIPSRKRSQSAAGIQHGDDDNGGEKRSKRIRRRETQQEEVVDPSTLHATQLQQYQAADQYLFQMTKNILENLGVTDATTVERLNEVLDSCAADDRGSKITATAAADLRHALTTFSEDNAKVLLNKKDQPSLGLSSFLEHAKSGTQKLVPTPQFDDELGVKAFASKMNRRFVTLQDLPFEWLRAIHPSYLAHQWSDAMKLAVVQVISKFDAEIYERVRYEIANSLAENEDWNGDLLALDAMVQMVFELHLDIYERITNPNSVVEYGVRLETKGRLSRWLDVASEMSRLRPESQDSPVSCRFLWAAVFSTTLTDNASRDYILQCWTDLRDQFSALEVAPIELPNNPVMPEVSAAAADREISKLTTMDFFLSLFKGGMDDAVLVIHNLEPVLNPESVVVEDASADGVDGKPSTMPIRDNASQGLQDLWKFLSGTSTELRLFLWSRLADAYAEIEYTTGRFSCYLKSIEMIVTDLESDMYLKHPQESRIPLLFRLLKALDEQLIQALSMALNDPSAFDIVDDAHIASTSSALAKLNSMLHVSAMQEDEVRIGMAQWATNSATMNAFLNRLREMQVRVWSLQYSVLKLGINNNPAAFPSPETDLASFLAATHQVLGLRKFCKASNKIFLKMMRMELLRMDSLENWEDYLGQVLYDLHGLKLGVGLEEVQDHGCAPEKLEKKNAVQLVERVTALAKGISMKDLLKSDLKTTIEHMQQAIGQTKSTPQMMYNFKNFTEYLRRPIHPLRLYQALHGDVMIDAIAVNTPEAALAKHGWFFLLGMIAFTKFKGVDLNRRQTPGATDDLRIGATFIRLQLQFTPDKWDAWFRLAECHDYEIDEAVLWTADKMNKERPELVKLQRNAIHCYTLALSNSYAQDVDADEGDPLYELYHNFAMRLYATSREPFAMEPFHHEDQERFFIENLGAGTFKKILHGQMSDYKVWKYAARLFKKAMKRKPKDWRDPWMYSKCLWKMYQKSDEQLDEKDRAAKPSMDMLVEALEKAIQVVVAVPKSRNSDPILEPHYKIVSIVHKLVSRRDLSPQQGAEILSRQPFGVQPSEDEPVEDLDSWEGYIIKNIRALKDKDKSNWQHRIIMRHARILYDENSSSNEEMPARAAIEVLRESMFTKTMVMNVWKCDAERAGRHHVYTTQYTRFMVKLLMVTNDRINLEALLRRLRKKGADFYHFNDLWQACCSSYLRLLRATHQVPLTIDDAFKSVSMDEFEILSERLSDWAATTSPTEAPAAFNCMKETIELKKLNGGQMRVAAIDDLIHDSYTVIYFDIAKDLPGRNVAEILEERAAATAAEKEAAAVTSSGQTETANDEAKPYNTFNSILNPPSGAATPQSTADPGDRPLGAASEAVHRRKTGIKRAEVLKKAEQAVIRATEAPRPAGGAGATSKSRLGSISSGKNGSNTPNGDRDDEQASENGDADGDVEMKEAEDDGGGENAEEAEEGTGEGAEEEAEEDHEDGDEDGEGAEPDQETVIDAPIGKREESSVPGSVHDSADDESDLSDVPEGYDDDPPPSFMFPGLVRRQSQAVESEVESDNEEEEEEEEEEEDEDEDEEEGDEEDEEEGEEGEDDEDGAGEEEEEQAAGEDEEGDAAEVADEDVTS